MAFQDYKYSTWVYIVLLHPQPQCPVDFMEKSSINILQNICFWVMQMKVHHMSLEAYEGESIIKSQTKQTNTTKHIKNINKLKKTTTHKIKQKIK